MHMATDKTIRNLASLKGASSSRVLNLVAIALSSTEQEDSQGAPLFHSSVLNSSIILKHRLRPDEVQCFDDRRAVATKIIVPFQKAELRIGGQSLFIGQRGFESLILEIGNFRDPDSLEKDLRVLKLIETVPSLDPFILREYLRSNGIQADDRYFRISAPELLRMHEYAAKEVGRLTAMATGASDKRLGLSAAKLTSALLSNEVSERLEPLRLTLNLPAVEFCEGVFGWRGFIYYKWSLGEFWPKLIEVLRSIKKAQPSGRTDPERLRFLEQNKNSILRGAKRCSDDVRHVIGIYDNAYATLIENQYPKLFREFLLEAPSLFLEFGEKIGAMSHIASFWQYRFPSGSTMGADADELAAIFEDFSRSLGSDSEGENYQPLRKSQMHFLDC
jgi:hypothetical protein